MQKPEIVQRLDATGLLCPLPVLKIRKRLKPLNPGELLEVMTDDAAALVDVPHFCNENEHTVVSQRDEGDSMVFLIRKGKS